MRNLLVLAVLAASCLLAGCNKTGTPVEYASACSDANEKKYIEVSGYLTDGGSLFCSNTGGGPVRCGFKLLQNAGDKTGFSADIERGGGANTVDPVTSGYKKEDIKVRDNSGNVINLADKVRITGELNYLKGTAGNPDVCYVTVTKIEK